MAGPIARRPQGLLDLLLTQQQGKNPAELGDLLLPVLELGHFYETDRIKTKGATITATTINSNATIEIPAGEAWKVYGFSVRGTFATVDQEVRVGFRISNIAGGEILESESIRFEAFGATDQFGNGIMFPQPIIYPSGAKFTCYTQELDLDAQPSIALRMVMLYIEMNV